MKRILITTLFLIVVGVLSGCVGIETPAIPGTASTQTSPQGGENKFTLGMDLIVGAKDQASIDQAQAEAIRLNAEADVAIKATQAAQQAAVADANFEVERAVAEEKARLELEWIEAKNVIAIQEQQDLSKVNVAIAESQAQLWKNLVIAALVIIVLVGFTWLVLVALKAYRQATQWDLSGTGDVKVLNPPNWKIRQGAKAMLVPAKMSVPLIADTVPTEEVQRDMVDATKQERMAKEMGNALGKAATPDQVGKILTGFATTLQAALASGSTRKGEVIEADSRTNSLSVSSASTENGVKK